MLQTSGGSNGIIQNPSSGGGISLRDRRKRHLEERSLELQSSLERSNLLRGSGIEQMRTSGQSDHQILNLITNACMSGLSLHPFNNSPIRQFLNNIKM